MSDLRAYKTVSLINPVRNSGEASRFSHELSYAITNTAGRWNIISNGINHEICWTQCHK